jgi:hypothetical protein
MTIRPVALRDSDPRLASTPGIQPGETFQVSVSTQAGDTFTQTAIAPDDPGEYDVGNVVINPEQPSAGRIGDPGRLGMLSAFEGDREISVETVEQAGGATDEIQSTTDNNPEIARSGEGRGGGGGGGLAIGVVAAAVVAVAAVVIGGS